MESGGPSTQLYQKIFHAHADGLLIVDAKGNILDANQSSCRMFEKEPSQIIGKHASEMLCLPLEKAALALFLLSCGSQKKRRIAGDILPDVGPGQHLVILKDITESEQRYYTLTETLPHMIWTATKSGEIDFANEVCLHYTGIHNQEKFSKNWHDAIHDSDSEVMQAAWFKSIRDEIDFSAEYRVRRHDGIYRWFLGRAVPVKNPEGTVMYWVGSATDIEDQKQAIENLQLERVLREQFISMLTHDLRNPFSAAKITAQLLARQTHSPEKIKNLTGRIIGSLNRANQMIENLLDANRIKAGVPLHLEMEDYQFMPLLELSLQEVRGAYGDRFQIECREFDLKGHGNPDAVRRIIENLCSNAAKYGAEKTPITVSLKRDENHALIEVHNFGNPISPEEQEQLFEPYRRTPIAGIHKIKGWGLGLTLARGLAKAHGGTIEVKSDEIHGTTFTAKILLQAHPLLDE